MIAMSRPVSYSRRSGSRGTAYTKIYWNGSAGLPNYPFYYEPPAGYDYKWTPD